MYAVYVGHVLNEHETLRLDHPRWAVAVLEAPLATFTVVEPCA